MEEKNTLDVDLKPREEVTEEMLKELSNGKGEDDEQ